MKNVVDVLSIQSQRRAIEAAQRPSSTDYRKKSNKNGFASRFLFECSVKLAMKPLTTATAATLFHRFFREADTSSYDLFLIASASIYLSGKIKDDPVKIRDVINVSHNTLNRTSGPLELGEEYWSMRDAIVQAELLITRMLKFELNTVHPHKYMLYYMKSLQDWLGPTIWNSAPIAKSAAAFLQDFHHNAAILNYKPEHVAVSCLSLALQTYGIQVPSTDENDDKAIWYHVFVQDLTKDLHWEISEKIIEVYSNEAELDN